MAVRQGAHAGKGPRGWNQRDDPQPGGGEFAVETAGFAEHQVAVQLIQRGAQRQYAARPVDDEITGDATGTGIDEDGTALGLAKALLGEQNSSRVTGLGRRPYRDQRTLR